MKPAFVVTLIAVCAITHSKPILRDSLISRNKRSAREDESRADFLRNSKTLLLLKQQCKNGQFLSDNTWSCEDCEKHCPNNENMSLCGEECKTYYKEKMYEERDRKNKATINQLKEDGKKQQTTWITIVTLLGACFFIILSALIIFLLWRKFCRHVPEKSQQQEQHIHTTPKDDPDNREYHEQNYLLETATKQARNSRQESKASVENGAQ